MSPRLILSESARVRFLLGTLLYFAQGIPSGLLHIALPTWLAANDVPAPVIASYMAAIVLPWAFKLLTGPLMDRYEFLPMGRRRPWVLGAQLGLSLSLLSLVLIDDPVAQVGLLTLCGVLINCFAATQDVAVDGMAIDLVPEQEQGRINAFMACGKAVGWASSSALAGMVLVTLGLGVAAVLASVGAAVIFLLALPVLERPGERRLPWGRGEPAVAATEGRSFAGMFAGLNAVLWSPVSRVVIAIMVLDGMVSGYGHALMPVAAVKVFGFDTPQWSQLVAMMGLVGAVLSLGLGPLIDRFGAKRMMLATVLVSALHAFALAATQALWADPLFARLMLSLWIILGPVTMVCALALAMAICAREVSATQFAIYMSIANLGSSAGAKLFGQVAERASYAQNYLLLGGLIAASLVAIGLFRARQPSAA